MSADARLKSFIDRVLRLKTHTNTIGNADLLPRATEAGEERENPSPANSRPAADHHAGRAFYSSAGAASADSPGERQGTVALFGGVA